VVDFLKNNLWTTLRPYVLTSVVTFSLTCLFVLLLSSRREDKLVSSLREQQKINDAAFAKIAEAQAEERKAHEENLKNLRTSLEEAQKKYDQEIENLKKKKAEQVTALVKKYEDDPSAMAREVSKATGLRVVEGEQK